MADDSEAREQKTLETIKLSCLPTYPGGVSWSLDDRISVITDQCVYVLVSFNILTHYKLDTLWLNDGFKMTGNPIFFSNLRNRRTTFNWKYDMSIMIWTLCPLRSLTCSKTFFFRRFSLLFVWESMQYCSQVVTPLPWHLNYFLSSVTLAFGGKFLAHAFIQCRSILLSCSIIRCSSYLPLFAFVYWISIHSVKWNFPPKARVTLDRK